jgi:transcriptional antiterminator RfaH
MPLLPKGTEVFPGSLFELPVETFPWFAAQVRSRQEKVLARHLERGGVPFYLPLTEKTSARGGRMFRSYVPLFPGYVFVRGGAAAQMAARRSNVVANLITIADQNLVHDELLQLRRLQLAGASLSTHPHVVAGTPVRVTDGAFAGYTGVVVREKGGDRFIIAISHLHRGVAVELPRGAFQRHSQARS